MLFLNLGLFVFAILIVGYAMFSTGLWVGRLMEMLKRTSKTESDAKKD